MYLQWDVKRKQNILQKCQFILWRHLWAKYIQNNISQLKRAKYWKKLSFSCQNSIFFLFLPPFSQNVDIVIESKWLQPYTKQTYHIREQHTHVNKHSLQLGHWAQSKEEQAIFMRMLLGILFSVANYITQCGNFRIFLSYRFYVKSILDNVAVLKMPCLLIWCSEFC